MTNTCETLFILDHWIKGVLMKSFLVGLCYFLLMVFITTSCGALIYLEIDTIYKLSQLTDNEVTNLLMEAKR